MSILIKTVLKGMHRLLLFCILYELLDSFCCRAMVLLHVCFRILTNLARMLTSTEYVNSAIQSHIEELKQNLQK